ncbi:MAG: hypothetical protein JWO86_519 [Myxococcaceae bacterium]|nr:hypothetical protein [Myxococcaceae bacterium]
MKASFVLAAFLAFALAACRPATPPPCYDCGPCGIVGGPGQENILSMSDAGMTTDGRHAVRIAIGTRGECSGRTTDLVWDGAAASLTASSTQFRSDPSVNSSVVRGEKLWWTSPAFVFTFAAVPGTHTGTLTVQDAEKTTVLHCSSDEYVVSCTR